MKTAAELYREVQSAFERAQEARRQGRLRAFEAAVDEFERAQTAYLARLKSGGEMPGAPTRH